MTRTERLTRPAGGPSPGVEGFVERFHDFPCGAAIKSDDQLNAALESRSGAVFILRANGLELAGALRRIHAAGKLAAVHLDLVEGLASDISGVRWLVRCGADAVISSHGHVVPAGKAEGLVAIQRPLCTSQMSIDLGLAAVLRAQPDVVELLPGVILPSVADLVRPHLSVPLLAGGFIRDREDVDRVLA